MNCFLCKLHSFERTDESVDRDDRDRVVKVLQLAGGARPTPAATGESGARCVQPGAHRCSRRPLSLSTHRHFNL